MIYIIIDFHALLIIHVYVTCASAVNGWVLIRHSYW